MTDLQKKQLAFLEDTVAHYNSENRCSSKLGMCRYSPKSLHLEGKTDGCAIGRHLPEYLALELDGILGGSGVSQNDIFNQLPESLKELGQKFLCSVQCLHDHNCNWCPTGLSETGKLEVEGIKYEFNL